MITKLKFGAAAAVLTLSALTGVALASPAQATDPVPEQRSVTTTLTDRDESGNHGVWAHDRLVRTVVLTGGPAYVVPEGAAALDAKVATGDGLCESVKALGLRWKYHAEVRDAGSFVTLAGSALSPNDGLALASGVKGEVVGKFTADFEAPAHWCSFDASALAGKTVKGADAPKTSTWVSSLFTSGFSGDSINNDWSWTYTTCVEKWWDAADPKSHDGELDKAGDITGKACPTPSVPATNPAGTGPTHAAGGTGGGKTLPVTGSATSRFVGFGVLVLAAGASLIALSRQRRKTRFES